MAVSPFYPQSNKTVRGVKLNATCDSANCKWFTPLQSVEKILKGTIQKKDVLQCFLGVLFIMRATAECKTTFYGIPNELY